MEFLEHIFMYRMVVQVFKVSVYDKICLLFHALRHLLVELFLDKSSHSAFLRVTLILTLLLIVLKILRRGDAFPTDPGLPALRAEEDPVRSEGEQAKRAWGNPFAPGGDTRRRQGDQEAYQVWC